MKMQLAEVQYGSMLIFTPFLLFFAANAKLLPMLIFILLSLLASIFPFIVKTLSEKKYGNGILYNRIFKIMELHLHRTSNWGQFVRIVSKTRKISRDLNVAILFYTDHYEETRLIELANSFGMRYEIKHANLFQSFVYKFTSMIATIGITREKKYPVLKCVIKP